MASPPSSNPDLVSSLNSILLDPTQKDSFYKTLQCLFCEENFDFYVQGTCLVEEIEASETPETPACVEHATRIMKKYISPGSPQEVNLDSEIRDEIVKLVERESMKELIPPLKLALKWVFQLMAYDSLPKHLERQKVSQASRSHSPSRAPPSEAASSSRRGSLSKKMNRKRHKKEPWEECGLDAEEKLEAEIHCNVKIGRSSKMAADANVFSSCMVVKAKTFVLTKKERVPFSSMSLLKRVGKSSIELELGSKDTISMDFSREAKREKVFQLMKQKSMAKIDVPTMRTTSTSLEGYTKGSMTEDDWEVVLQDADLNTYKEGQHIIHDGQVGEWLYYVVKGRVLVQKNNIDVCFLGEGQMFGEMSFLDSRPASADVLSGCDGLVLNCLRGEVLSRHLNLDSGLAKRFYLFLAFCLSERLRRVTPSAMAEKKEDSVDEVFPGADTEDSLAVFEATFKPKHHTVVPGALRVTPTSVIFIGTQFGMSTMLRYSMAESSFAVKKLHKHEITLTTGKTRIVDNKPTKHLDTFKCKAADKLCTLINKQAKEASCAKLPVPPEAKRAFSSFVGQLETLDSKYVMGVEDWGSIMQRAETKLYNCGEALMVENQPNECLFQIIEGECVVKAEDKIIFMASAGEVVGEISFLSGGSVTSSVIVSDPSGCTVLVLTKSSIEGLFSQCPLVGAKFYRQLGTLLSTRIRRQTY